MCCVNQSISPSSSCLIGRAWHGRCLSPESRPLWEMNRRKMNRRKMSRRKMNRRKMNIKQRDTHAFTCKTLRQDFFLCVKKINTCILLYSLHLCKKNLISLYWNYYFIILLLFTSIITYYLRYDQFYNPISTSIDV